MTARHALILAERYYSSTAEPTTLSGSINDSVTTIQVASATGYPASTPFTINVDPETSSSELMDVVGVSGLNWTVVRGVDGSSALPHSAGAAVRHDATARDFRDSRTHEQSSSNVHGIAPADGNIVATSKSQTLTNKVLTAPSISNPTMTGGGSWAGSPTLTTPNIASFANANHNHTNSAGGGLLTFPHAGIRRAATVNLTAGTDNTITLDTSDYETGGDWWTAGSLVTLPANGYYLAHCWAIFQNAGTNAGLRIVQLKRQGDGLNLVEAVGTGPGGSTTDWLTVGGTQPYVGAAGQQFYLNVKHTASAALTLFQAFIGFTLIERA